MNGIKGAIDFLRGNVSVEKLENLPYPTLIVPLAAYFAATDSTSVPLSDAQRVELLHWFWRSSFSRRFSAGVLKNLNRDVHEAIKLRDKRALGLAEIPWSIERDFFTETRFTIGSVNTKFFVLLLAQQKTLSFVSAARVSLAEVLRDYNRSEFHHLFPRSYLKNQGRDSSDINRLANFARISAVDNKPLGGIAPSRYQARMPGSRIDEILAAAVCPRNFLDDAYEDFLTDRGGLLDAAPRKLTG